jgi:HD-GYP domain-containing protein (c-di-GMP phosphodiesterase class II)
VARAIGLLVTALGAAVMLGWAAGIAPLRQVGPGLPVMVPNTALGLSMAGLALWLVAARRRSRLALACGCAVALLGALTLAEYGGWSGAGLDTALLPGSAPESTFPGRPSPNTALNLALGGVALVLVAARDLRLVVVSQGLAVLVALNGLRALLGHIAGVTGFYELSGTGATGTALHSALAFVALACGLCFVRADAGAMAVLLSGGPGGVALRFLLPFGVLLPLAMGAVTYRGQATSIFGAGFSLVVFTLLDLVVFWALAAALNRYAAAQAHAAAEAERHARRAEALLTVARALGAQLDLPTVLRTVCDTVAAALGAPVVSVALSDPRGRRLTPAADVGLTDASRAAMRPVARAAHDAFTHGGEGATLVEDLRARPNVPNAEALSLAGARALAVVEMCHRGSLVGTLTVAGIDEAARFSPDDLSLLGGLADHAAQAIANARLHAKTEAQALATSRLHAATERRLRNVRALHAIDNAILTSRHRDQALAAVMEQALAELEVDLALIWIADARGLSLRPGPSLGLREHAPDHRLDLSLRTLASEAAVGRRAVWRAGTPRELGSPHLVREEAAFAATAPLIANGVVLGVLEVAQRSAREPDAEWLSFLTTLAGQAAIAVDYLRALDDLELANDALVAAYDATLEGWAHALDLRDQDTAGHCERVTSLTVQLAEIWGLPEEEVTQIRRGALLHDIGKLGVPDSILLKPGRLTDEERQVMELHPVYAYEWLSPIAFLAPALDIPYAHHEKWDGTGYPRGLRGDEIPLAARLFAVVDVWDALTSDRPYRAAWTPDQALAYLEARAGSHFDPLVVRAFRSLVPDSPERERAVGA